MCRDPRLARAAIPGGFDRLLDAAGAVGSQVDPVDDHLDARLRRHVTWPHGVDVAHLARDDETPVAVPSERLADFEELLRIADAQRVAHDRSLAAACLDGARGGIGWSGRDREGVALGAGRDGFASEERGEVRLEISHRGERRAARLDGRAAIDRDGRRDGVERFDGRTFEALEELPRVGAEAFDESPLPLCIERIERERRFAGTARPRHAHELAGVDIERDLTQVVRARAAQADGVHGGSHDAPAGYRVQARACTATLTA